MEGVWFAYDSATGRPIYQRVKVLDRTEHPTLKAGKPVTVFPSSIGGLNYSPASFDPNTNYILNAAAETAAVDVQAKLTPTQKKRKFNLGDVFLGLANGNFGAALQGWHDHGSISAIDVNSGKRVWKFTTPEPERGGVTTTDSGVGFAGGGDGVLRAFDLKDGKVLWTFQTGHQIASGPSLFSIDGKEYLAITVGGTPTSSSGGTATELQVFALGASSNQSPAPPLPLGAGPRTLQQVVQRAGPERRAAPRGVARIATQGGLVVRPWLANSSNVARVSGRLALNGAPVVGARVAMDGFVVPAATDERGSFFTDVDITIPGRRAVRVVEVDHATVRGHALSAPQKSALTAASGGFSVGYGIEGLRAKKQSDGSVVVTGRLAGSAGQAPPTVRLLTYRLQGTVTDTTGKPVQGAVVITRTQDRDFWTHSSASDASGRFTSFFAASDETAADPVILAVGVASGGISYGGVTGTNASFKRLESSVLDIKLGPGSQYALQQPQAQVGAIYSGLVVGANAGGKVVKPLSERWPDARGGFSMRLPGSVKGKTLTLWENDRQFFSARQARPGGPVDLTTWPSQLGEAVSTGLARIRVP
jgi:hypothetical protein